MNLLDEIKKIKSTTKELREFGFVVGGALLVITGISYWRHGTWHWPLAAAGAVLALLGLVWPRILMPLQKVWMTLALAMGWVMSRVILSLLFFVIVTPIALILRAQGKRFLERGATASMESYWNLRKPQAGDSKRCERQY